MSIASCVASTSVRQWNDHQLCPSISILPTKSFLSSKFCFVTGFPNKCLYMSSYPSQVYNLS